VLVFAPLAVSTSVKKGLFHRRSILQTDVFHACLDLTQEDCKRGEGMGGENFLQAQNVLAYRNRQNRIIRLT
jgi:hypothetical protein